MSLADLRALATLQAVVETPTPFGGLERAWSDVTELWVALEVGGATARAQGGLRPVLSEDATAEAHDHPLAAQGQRLVAGGDNWRVVRLVRGAPRMGRMTLYLERDR